MTASKAVPKKLPLLAAALLVVAVLAGVAGPAPSQAAPPPAGRFVATEVLDSPAGRQLAWLIDASTRLPISEAELRAHLTKAFLTLPGTSPTMLNRSLRTTFDAGGIRLRGLTIVKPNALVAVVTGRNAQALALTLLVDRGGRIEFARFGPATSRPVVLPKPSGRAAVGTDIVQLVDRARGGRRLALTRWYPAASSAPQRPVAKYASPLLTAMLGLPEVRVHARTGAKASPGRLPVVLLSPGGSTPRILYQALAEDLASHGYLVISLDHTGEAPVEFPGGRIELPAWGVPPPSNPIAGISATRLADMRFLLRRLSTMPKGPLPDPRRVAAMGHSLGGSTAAALMRVEPTVLAGIDLDGSIVGAAARRGVPRAFLVMTGEGLDASVRGLLKHSRGSRLALDVAGFEHMSFSDMPVVAPDALRLGKRPSARDIVLQRAYVRAFLDRHLLNRPSPLLDGPSRRFPQVSFEYRGWP
jgi:dienelactone hydrolase